MVFCLVFACAQFRSGFNYSLSLSVPLYCVLIRLMNPVHQQIPYVLLKRLHLQVQRTLQVFPTLEMQLAVFQHSIFFLILALFLILACWLWYTDSELNGAS